MVKRIGFIGLGAMGLPMARNVLNRGFELHIAPNRNYEPVEQLTKLGAVAHKTAGEVASNCDILISILPADREMEAVLLSDEVLGALHPGQLLIEMTSGSPSVMKKVSEAYAAKQAEVLDAPVSGGTIGAEKGTLTVMAGGEARTLDRARPVLEAMSNQIYLIGSIGAGKAVKAINQMLAGIHMIATAEAAALARKMELDFEALKQVIGASSGASWMFLNKLDSVAHRQFKPGFKLSLMTKDVEIALQEAGELDLTLAAAALKRYREAAKTDSDLDFSAIGQSLPI